MDQVVQRCAGTQAKTSGLDQKLEFENRGRRLGHRVFDLEFVRR